jgi:hypothetical protein
MSDGPRIRAKRRIEATVLEGKLPNPVSATHFVGGNPWEQKVTVKAADGIHNLRRYWVVGIVYAPTLREAVSRISSDIFLDAAAVYRG